MHGYARHCQFQKTKTQAAIQIETETQIVGLDSLFDASDGHL